MLANLTDNGYPTGGLEIKESEKKVRSKYTIAFFRLLFSGQVKIQVKLAQVLLLFLMQLASIKDELRRVFRGAFPHLRIKE
jgi:hypothetical protein